MWIPRWRNNLLLLVVFCCADGILLGKLARIVRDNPEGVAALWRATVQLVCTASRSSSCW